jgi:PAS domain S-box-containing protein
VFYWDYAGFFHLFYLIVIDRLRKKDMEIINSSSLSNPGNNGERPREHNMVKIIYLTTNSILFVLAVVKIILPPALNLSDYVIWALIGLYSLIFVICRKRHMLLAGLLHASVLWGSLTILAFVFEGVRDVSVIGYIICILIVVSFDQFRYAIAMGIFSLLSIWALYIFEYYGKLVPDLSSSLNYSIVLSAIFGMILVLLYRNKKNFLEDRQKLKEDYEERLKIRIELLNKEQALRESKLLNREIFDLYYGFMGIIDTDGIVLDVNRTALDFSGISLSDVKGKYFCDTPWWSHSPVARKQVREAIALAREGQQVRGESQHPDKNGNMRTVDFMLKPVKNEEGKVIYMIAEGFDITERKNVIQNLETLSRSAIEMINMPLHDNIYAAALERVKSLLPEDTIIVITLLDRKTKRFVPRSISGINPALKSKLESKGIDPYSISLDFSTDVMRTLASGKLKTIDATGIIISKLNDYLLSKSREYLSGKAIYSMGFVKSGKILGALEIVANGQIPVEIIKTIEALGNQLAIMLEKRHAEMSLRSSEERYRSIVETTTDWIWEIDLFGRLTFTNSGIVSILGYHPDEIRDQTIFELQHPDSYIESKVKYHDFIKEKMGWREWVLKWRHKDGTFRVLESNANPIMDSNGNLVGYRGNDRDVTHRVVEAEETRAALERRKVQQEVIGSIAASPMLAEGDVKGIMKFITAAASRAFGCERVSIWMLNEDMYKKLECQDLYERKTDSHSSGMSVDSAEYLSAFANERIFMYYASDDAVNDSLPSATVEEYIKPNGITSLLLSSIRISRIGLYGLLSVEHTGEKHHWEHDEITFARQLSDQIVLAFLNQETKGSEKMLKHKSDLQALMTKIATTYLFLPLESLDAAIFKSLGELSEFLGSYRSYLFDFDYAEGFAKLRIEWKSETATGYIKDKGIISLEDLSIYNLEAHLRGETIFFYDLENIPDGALKKLTIHFGGKSLISVPLMKSGECMGFIGFAWDRHIKRVNPDELNIIRIFALMLVNISIRKISHEALLRSEEKFRELVENMNDVFFTLDVNGNITYISPQVQQTYNLEAPAAMIGRPLTDFVLAEDHEAILSGFADTLNNIIEPREFRYINNDGEVRWAISSSRPIVEKGTVTGIRGILTDVTRRKQNEEELRKLSVAIEQSPVVIVITDLAGNIDYVNPKFSELTGYTKAEAIGKNPRILKSGKTKPEVYAEMWSRLTEGREWRGEFLNRKKNGDLFWESAFIAPILNVNGQITHYIAVKEDVTDKKEATKLIFDKIIETEERERLRYSEELHDGLGPIISTIKLYFQLLSEDNDAEQRDIILSKASTCIDEAIMTIKEISFNLSPNVLNKFGLVAGIQNFISRLNDVCPFRIEYKCNVERRFERNIEISIYRIITEMINNTVKYASATSVSINLNFNKKNSNLIVEYSDNGAGFDMNEAINNQRGLGLSNINQRVNTLGGSIVMESLPGKGMKARIELQIFN